jgi:hypothetical protein
MAPRAEMLSTFNAGRLAAIGRMGRRVAVKATPQAVFLCTKTVMHGFIALVFQQCHVITAHEILILDALFAKRRVLVLFIVVGKRPSDTNHQQERGQKQICPDLADDGYSPRPIWI